MQIHDKFHCVLFKVPSWLRKRQTARTMAGCPRRLQKSKMDPCRTREGPPIKGEYSLASPTR